MYDKRQRGIQEAMGRVGMNNQRENPYSPFGGNVPAQTLEDLTPNQMQGASVPMPQPPMQPSLAQVGIGGGPGRLPQAPPQVRPQMQQPQQSVASADPMMQRNPRLAQLMKNPRFLEMLRRRRGGMR